MHILNCAKGERFSIGQEITLCVVAVNGNSVRLGVEAPKHISVHRSEIFERIKSQSIGHPASDPVAQG